MATSPVVVRTFTGGATALYTAAVATLAVATAMLLSGDGWAHESQFVRSPVALLALSSALGGAGGLASTAAGNRSALCAVAGVLGAVAWGAFLLAT